MPVNRYSYSKEGSKKLSAHFCVAEFGSTDGSKVYSNTVLIDTALVDLLEKVYAHFNCSKIILSSGYRTASHDRAVGGSGSGYHVSGQAADFCCYDKSGNPIPSSKVVLYLEDIKCYGIGYKCGGAVNYTHADTRSASCKWWGDESRNFTDIKYLTGATSFYTYLGVKKTTTSTTATQPKPAPDKTMNISAAGIDFIKSHEGLCLTAYKCLSTEQYYTIGYGHYGSDVNVGQTITQAQAESILKKDLESFVNCVNKAVTVAVTQAQFDALVSLCYNIGTGAFASSDLVKHLNAGKMFHACAEFPLWRKSGGAIIAGLQSRRQKELTSFAIGQDFVLEDVMNVRSGPGTNFPIKKVSQLSVDGRKNAVSPNLASNAVYKKGTIITCLEVKVVTRADTANTIDIWLRTPSGWICGKQGNDIFMR